MKISKDWTLEERVEIVCRLLPAIQDDIAAGRYSAPGRTNLTSLQHILSDTVEQLEQGRESIERFLAGEERRSRVSRGYSRRYIP